MPDRRRGRRFTLTCPASAHVHVAADVFIERSDAETFTVLSAATSVPGEEFDLRLRAADGRTVSVPVRTIRSRPVFLPEQAVSYRIDLRVIAASGQTGAAPEGV